MPAQQFFARAGWRTNHYQTFWQQRQESDLKIFTQTLENYPT
jgi:hypothetical protein